ncbi:hypothetical protein F4678DRAFT_34568 [Xylaria arbuscula]|nr:hypothetical protein F4678DRAFT_34568 [Xylaria arbuscula]
MDFSFQGLVHSHSQQMDAAFRSLVDTLIQNSKLNITLLRISNVTEDSFHVTLEARLTKTGPATAKITPMTVDLCGPSGHFGNVRLPAITTRAFGTDVVVTSQLVSIVDKDALKAFIQAIIKDDVELALRNGQTTITALGIGPRDVVYQKEILLHGMRGPIVGIQAASLITANPSLGTPPTTANPGVARSHTATSVSSTLGGENAVSVVLRVSNPSPLEISFGICSFDIQDDQGRLVAELKGRLDIRRNQFEVTFQGNVNKAVAAKLATDMGAAARAGGSKYGRKDGRSPKARLVGKRCVGAGWCDETVKSINVPLQDVSILFETLGIEDGAGEPQPHGKSGGGFTGWGDRFMLR